MRFGKLLGGVLAGAVLTAVASADVLYDNFGPGDTFNTGTGWTIGTTASNWEPAFAVVISGTDDFFLNSITAAISFVTGPNNAVTLTVHEDNAGLPGTALESVGGSNFDPFGGAFTPPVFAFSGNTVLSAGSTYWISFATIDNGESWLVWNQNDQNETLPRAFRNNSTGGQWQLVGDSIAGAMRIEGTIVPAPGALALIGLAGLVSSRRRRR